MERGRGHGGGGAAAPGREPEQEIWLLGPLTVLRGRVALADHEIGSRKARTLLKRLLVDRDRVVSIDSLAEVVWPGGPPEHAERQVATLVSRLRAALGRDIVVRVGEGYRFGGGAGYAVDVDEAGRLVGEAESRLAAGEPGLAYTAAGRGLELLGRGDLLADEPDADWLAPARQAAAGLLRRARRSAAAAALALDDHAAAIRFAEAALAADPFDEQACRVLMRAHHGHGEPAAALTAYERLRTLLADELGTDPAEQTRALHRSILRDESAPAAVRPGPLPAVSPATLVGREAELAWLRQAWTRATDGAAGLVLLVGEAGIGKTTLALEVVRLVAATGGTVARARCYEAERSLFLQPVAEALRSVVVATHPDLVREAAGPVAGSLAELVAEVGEVLRPPEHPRADPEVERRRVFETVAGFIRTLAARRPVLLFLDDLHLAGSSTLELLHFLTRRVEGHRAMLLATVRAEECGEVIDVLGGLAAVRDLGPLSADAVGELARRAGAAELAGQIMARTRGHCLYVVESLRALAEQPAGGDPAVPESLRAAVMARMRRAGPAAEELLRAAATLGAGIDPALVAALLGTSVEDAVRGVTAAASARLVSEAGTSYEFANDLIREIAYESTPLPIRIARHRRAAQLLVDNPEAVAGHANRAGDWSAAVRAYQQAAEAASRRYANKEAEHLLDQAIQAAVRADDPQSVARARLARGRVREVLADYQGAYEDHSVVVELARAHGRTDLELAALNQLGGDLLVGLGRSTRECIPYLEAALVLAAKTADLPGQVDILSRLAVIWTNRLRFDRARELVDRAMVLAEQSGDETVEALALDAVKTTLAYRGEVAELARLLPRLDRSLMGYQPGLRRYRQVQLRVWAAFESAFPALAQGQWPQAATRIEQALAIARESGYVAYEPPLLAHLAWVERARGRYGEALRHGRRAVDLAGQTGHPWWMALAGTMHGWTLTELGAFDEAVEWLQRSLPAAESDATEGYLVRCLGHLAWALSLRGDVERARSLAGRAEAVLGVVSGGPFRHGAHAGLAAASARIVVGDTEGAARLVEPIRRAAAGSTWAETRAWADLLAAGYGEPARAAQLAGAALATARQADLPGLTWQAHGLLAELAPPGPDGPAHVAAAAAIVAELAAGIDDAELRDTFRAHAGARRSPARPRASA
jgi:DNA-binding SARP family transcriptional activator